MDLIAGIQKLGNRVGEIVHRLRNEIVISNARYQDGEHLVSTKKSRIRSSATMISGCERCRFVTECYLGPLHWMMCPWRHLPLPAKRPLGPWQCGRMTCSCLQRSQFTIASVSKCKPVREKDSCRGTCGLSAGDDRSWSARVDIQRLPCDTRCIVDAATVQVLWVLGGPRPTGHVTRGAEEATAVTLRMSRPGNPDLITCVTKAAPIPPIGFSDASTSRSLMKLIRS